jgi:17 kDa outer membrane surface antigen
MSAACRTAALAALLVVSLSACATHGIDSATADLVDKGTSTGSLPAGVERPDPIRASDETTIRNAVSAADPEQAKVEPLAWANADTGSRGSISEMMEKEEGGVLCRQFKASREAFDGVALYQGDACKGVHGAWYMRDFKPL